MSQIPGLGNYNAQRFSQHVPSISVSDADEALANVCIDLPQIVTNSDVCLRATRFWEMYT